eukprot:1499830-Pleurochrysis_carterae.AAC.1
MQNQLTGTMSAVGTASSAQIALNERPDAKVPWYSGPFIPKPMRLHRARQKSMNSTKESERHVETRANAGEATRADAPCVRRLAWV